MSSFTKDGGERMYLTYKGFCGEKHNSEYNYNYNEDVTLVFWGLLNNGNGALGVVDAEAE